MTTTAKTPPDPNPPGELEQELHDLEASNDALDQRTGNIEMRAGFLVLFTFFALLVAIGALAVGLTKGGNNTTKTVIQRVAAPATAAPTAATPATPATPGAIAVKLGEMFVRPNVTEVKAGSTTFNVQNTGKLVHEMIVGRAPIKGPLASGKMSEATSVGEVAELKPGTHGSVKLNLKPGNYVLYCNVPGHYAAGQHVAFRVAAG